MFRTRDDAVLDDSLSQFLAAEVAMSSYGYVADRIGISKGMVERIVKNKQSATLYTVSKIQVGFRVSIAELLEPGGSLYRPPETKRKQGATPPS